MVLDGHPGAPDRLVLEEKNEAKSRSGRVKPRIEGKEPFCIVPFPKLFKYKAGNRMSGAAY